MSGAARPKVHRSTGYPEAKYGAWAALGSPLAVEALARSGVDFVGLDLQHGGFGFSDAARAIQLLDILGVECLVRLAAAELPLAPKLLDYGGSGIIVACCDSVAIAQAAVSIVRYQPQGTRSYGGRRFGIAAPSPSHSTPAVFVMIETIAGIHNLSEIGSVPGIAGLFVGPADLALALDLTLETSHSDPTWVATVEAVLGEADRGGLEAGMFAADGSEAAHWASLGFSRVVIGSDIGLIGGMANEVRLARHSVNSQLQKPHGERRT